MGEAADYYGYGDYDGHREQFLLTSSLYWRTQDGHYMDVDKMTDAHIINAICFFCRRNRLDHVQSLIIEASKRKLPIPHILGL